MNKKSRGPKDANKLGKDIVDMVTGGIVFKKEKSTAAVELGRRGGLKGGRARADKLTPERRKEIAQKAAKSRWGKKT